MFVANLRTKVSRAKPVQVAQLTGAGVAAAGGVWVCSLRGESGSFDTCHRGTLMAYATYRAPFFANRNFTVDGGDPLGDETHDAVEYLNRVKTGRSLAWELDQKRPPPYNPDADQFRYVPETILD